MAQRRSTADVWLEPASWEDRRVLRRMDSALPAALSRSDRTRSTATLLDISTRGCRIQAGSLREGDRVWLDLAGLEPICAHVAWATSAEAGLEFRQALHPAIVAQLADGSERKGQTRWEQSPPA